MLLIARLLNSDIRSPYMLLCHESEKEESGSASLLPSSPSSSPWVQFRSVLFVVSSASPANSCASSDRYIQSKNLYTGSTVDLLGLCAVCVSISVNSGLKQWCFHSLFVNDLCVFSPSIRSKRSD